MLEKLRYVPLVKKALAGLLVFLVLFTVVGFFVVPPILKSVLTKKLSRALHRDVAIGQIKVNPFLLSIDIKGFSLKDRKLSETFFSFDELYLDFQVISLIKRGAVVRELRMVRPYVKIDRNVDRTYNFSDLLEASKAKAAAATKPFRYSLNNIQILDGSIDFRDGPEHTKHTLRDITLRIPFLSNLPHYVDTFVQPTFEGKLNGEPISFGGRTKLFEDSLETVVNLDIKDFDIPYYLAYIPVQVNFKVVSGLLNVKSAISYTQYRGRLPTIVLKGNVDFKDLRIVDNNGGPLIHLPLVQFAVSSADVLAKQIHLGKILFQSPEFDLVLAKSGRMNVGEGALLPEKGYVLKRKEESPVLAVDADQVLLSGGKVSFSDLSREHAFRTTLKNIDVKVDHFSNGRDKRSVIALSLDTEAGEGMKFNGDVSVVPPSLEGALELNKIPLRRYAPYYSENVLFDIEKGDLDLTVRHMFTKFEPETEVRLDGIEGTLASLELRKRGEKEDFLTIPVMSLRDTSVDLSRREIVVGGLSTQRGLLKVQRLNDGTVNLATLMPPPPGGAEKSAALSKGKKGKPWIVTLKNIAVERYSVSAEDHVPSDPVHVVADQIKFKGTNLSTARNRTGKIFLSGLLNKTGTLSANGAVSIDPLSVNLSLDLKSLDILPAQSYFTDRIKIIMTSGALSAKGNLRFANGGQGELSAAYTGEAALTEFASVDKVNADDFLKWNSLHLGGMSVGYNPLHVKIDEIALADFYSRVIIDKDGMFNVQGIVSEGAAKEHAAGAGGERSTSGASVKETAKEPINIEKVTLQGGTINFSDRHIQPNFSANLLEIGGRVSGLSSEENTAADIDLRGKLDNYAPLEITGKINPLRDDLYVDLKIDFKDMDLSPVTPYADKYLGYSIQKGKLSLSLQYLIVKKKLDSQNKVLLDQFTLGDKVDSPDATKLPVRLAIALLKNRKGVIDLDLPVTGYIDDPKFSIGRIIIKILLNLLAKAATSPFALLGAIFGGGGEELSYLVFDYGSSSIPADGMKKLDALGKALRDRPSLKLEIEGHVDMEKDREGLRQYEFNKKVKAEKLKEMVKKGTPAIPVDEVVVGKEEYPKYLKMAYKDEKFPKPRNILGIAKDLPVPEMEKLMLTHLEVKDDDLRLLASERAKAAENYLLKAEQIDPERIFLVEPKSLQPEKNEQLKDSRVDFKLK